jgi:hypothetical protein
MKTDLPNFGEHFPLPMFRELVEYGAFTDDDGSAYLAGDDFYCENWDFDPSELGYLDIPDWASHVLWFNK